MAQKFYVHKVRVNRQGYDSSGRYWGINARQGDVYEYSTEDLPCFVNHIRAMDRSGAKHWVKACYPNATFYR